MGKKIDCGGPSSHYCRERQFPPSRCARGSLRTVTRGRNRVVVCCPRGKFKRGHCTVGTRAQTILRPHGSAKCGVCRIR